MLTRYSRGRASAPAGAGVIFAISQRRTRTGNRETGWRLNPCTDFSLRRCKTHRLLQNAVVAPFLERTSPFP